MGIGGAWGSREELLHPRGKDGRFITKGKMSVGIADALTKVLDAFSPRSFQSDQQAAQYLQNKANKNRLGGGSHSQTARYSADFDAVQEDLRDGVIDNPETKKFVAMMDQSMVELPEGLIASRQVGPEAFGLTTQQLEDPENGIYRLQGTMLADRGYSSMALGTYMGTSGPGRIRMVYALPAGTRVMIPATSGTDREITGDRDMTVRVSKIDADGLGGYTMYVVAVPRDVAGPTPHPIGGHVGSSTSLKDRRASIEQSRQHFMKQAKAGVGDTPEPVPGQPAPMDESHILPTTPPVPGAPLPGQEHPDSGKPSPVQQTPSAPGAPPARTEPTVTESAGARTPRSAPAAAPQAATPPPVEQPSTPGVPAAPEAPAVHPNSVPGTPEEDFVPTGTTFRDAFLQSDIPSPSAGPDRAAANKAFLALRDGTRGPKEVLRDLDSDIETARSRAEHATDDHGRSQAGQNADRLQQLRDLISQHYKLEAPPAKKAAPRKAAAPKLDEEGNPIPRTPRKAAVPKLKEVEGEEDPNHNPTELDAISIEGPAGTNLRRIQNRVSAGDITDAKAEKELRDAAKYFRAHGKLAAENGHATPEVREANKAKQDRIAEQYETAADIMSGKRTVRKAAKKAAPAKAARPKADESGAPILRGAALDKALKDAGLSTRGTADEKRARLAEGPKAEAPKAEAPAVAKAVKAVPAKAAPVKAAPAKKAAPAATNDDQDELEHLRNQEEMLQETLAEAADDGSDGGDGGEEDNGRDEGDRAELRRVRAQISKLEEKQAAAPPPAKKVAAKKAAPNIEDRPVNRTPAEQKRVDDAVVARAASLPDEPRNSEEKRIKDRAAAIQRERGVAAPAAKKAAPVKAAKAAKVAKKAAPAAPSEPELHPSVETPEARAALKLDGNPRADAPFDSPERAREFADAWKSAGIKVEKGSAGTSVRETIEGIYLGNTSPSQGLKQMESDISFNRDDLGDVQRLLRNPPSDATPAELSALRKKEAKIKRDIATQEKVAKFLHGHFSEEKPAAAEVQAKAPANVQEFLESARPQDAEDFRQAVKEAGGPELKGNSVKEMFQDGIRQALAERTKELAAKKATKAAPAEIPAPAAGKPDHKDVAGDLDLPHGAQVLLQKELNGRATTRNSAKKLRAWAASPDGPGARAALMEASGAEKTPSWQSEHDNLLKQNADIEKLATRLESTTRAKLSAPAPAPKTLSPAEEKRAADVADIAGVSPAKVQARMVEAKDSAAPAGLHHQATADILKSAGSRDGAAAILKDRGKTAADLKGIAKAAGIPVGTRDRKQAIHDAIVDHFVPEVGEPSVPTQVKAKPLTAARQRKAESIASGLHEDWQKTQQQLPDGKPLAGAAPKAAAPAAKKAVAAAVPAAPSDDIIAKLQDFDNPPSREESNAMLAGLRKAQLLEIAKKISLPQADRKTVAELRRDIVDGTSGARLDSIATRGFKGKTPLSDAIPDVPAGKAPSVQRAHLTASPDIAARLGRATGDEPLHVPNEGADQGLVHFHSQLGQLWQDLAADKREPNSVINEVAHIGEEVGSGTLSLDEAADRLKKLSKKAGDSAISSRIQEAIDGITEPGPVPKIDVPDNTPPAIRRWLEELAKVPTLRKTDIPGNHRKQSALDEAIETVRKVSEDPRQFRAGDAQQKLSMLTHNTHESIDGVYAARRLTGQVFAGQNRVVGFKNGKEVTEPNPDWPSIRAWLSGRPQPGAPAAPSAAPKKSAASDILDRIGSMKIDEIRAEAAKLGIDTEGMNKNALIQALDKLAKG